VVDQLEWLTGGECAAGMHEVVVSKSTLQAVEASQKAGRSLWRVSSTVSANSILFSVESWKPHICFHGM
jgi:hypothetical protein